MKINNSRKCGVNGIHNSHFYFFTFCSYLFYNIFSSCDACDTCGGKTQPDEAPGDSFFTSGIFITIITLLSLTVLAIIVLVCYFIMKRRRTANSQPTSSEGSDDVEESC
jgi:heme/copper-type cytochrome/quinol oxidase subunit 2